MPEIIISSTTSVDVANLGIQTAIGNVTSRDSDQLIIDFSGDKENPAALTQEELTRLADLMSTVASCLKPANAKSRPKIIFKASHRKLDAVSVKLLLDIVLGNCDGVDFSDNLLEQAGVAAVVGCIFADYEARSKAAEDIHEAGSGAEAVIKLPLKILALNNTGLTKGVELEALAKVAQLGELEELYLSHNDFSGVEFNGNPVNPDLLRASALGRAVWDFLDDGVQYVQVPGKQGSRLAVLDLSECGLSKPMHNHIAAIYEAVIRGKKGKRKGKEGHDHASLTLNLHDSNVRYTASGRRALQLGFIPRDRDTPKGKKGQGAITICDEQGEIVALQKPSRIRRASSATLKSKPADYDDPDIQNKVEAKPMVADTPVAKAEDVLWRQRILQNVEIEKLVRAVGDRLTPYCLDTHVSELPEWTKLARQVREAVQHFVDFQGDREAGILAVVEPLVTAIKKLSTREHRGVLTRKSMSAEEQSLHDELCYVAELTLAIGGFDPKKPYTFTRRMLGLEGAAQKKFEEYTSCNSVYILQPVTVMRSFAEGLAHKTDRDGALLWLSLNTRYLAENRALLAAYYLRQGRVSLTLEALNILPARELTALWELQNQIFTEFRHAAKRSGSTVGGKLSTDELFAAAKFKMGRDLNRLEREILQLLALEEHAAPSTVDANAWVGMAENVMRHLEEGSAQYILLGEIISVAKGDTFNKNTAERMIDQLRADCTRLLAEVQALANYEYGQATVHSVERSAAEHGGVSAAFVKQLCWAVSDERRADGLDVRSVAAASGRKRAHSVGAGSAGANYDKRVARVKDEYPFHILGNTIEMKVAAATAAPLPPPIAPASGVGGSAAGGSGDVRHLEMTLAQLSITSDPTDTRARSASASVPYAGSAAALVGSPGASGSPLAEGSGAADERPVGAADGRPSGALPPTPDSDSGDEVDASAIPFPGAEGSK